jgi:hypothetical protein
VSTGKLYRSSDEQFLANVNYQFQHQSPKQWWGELTLVEYLRLNDGSGYILELEDQRKSRCALKKRVNRAVTSLPPRYIYRFSGNGEFE